MKRYYIPNSGGDKSNVEKAFALALQLCVESKLTDIALVTAKKGDLPNTISDLLGKAASKQLCAGKSVRILGKFILRQESPRTITKGNEPSVVLAVHLLADDLNAVDTLRRTEAMIYVPWMEEDGKAWKRAWKAEVPGQPDTEEAVQLDPAVVEGLTALTNHINLSTGLKHPYDLRDAKEFFRKMIAQSVSFDPAEIRVWAVQNGWEPNHADDLQDLARRYQ